MVMTCRSLWSILLCGLLAAVAIPTSGPLRAQDADADQEEEFSIEEDVEMPADEDSPRPLGAPAAPPPGQGRVRPGTRPAAPPPPPQSQGYRGRFSNDMGKFDLHGGSGTAQYNWFDDQFHDDDLVLVRPGAIPGYDSDMEHQLHHGYVYRVAGAKFWLFFSKTPVGSRVGRPIYPLYYSFSSSRGGFKRWLSSSGTRYRPPQRPALLNDMDEPEEGTVLESRE